MFEAGKSGNPKGRPKGSFGGRIQALAELDRMMGRGQNRRLLARVLQEEFRKDPMGFFRSVIMPLLPKESKVALDRDGVIQWRSLLGGESEQRDQVSRLREDATGGQAGEETREDRTAGL